MIGGSLKVQSGEARGVTITCLFPITEAKEAMKKVAHDQ
jgi:hypothetical protein